MKNYIVTLEMWRETFRGNDQCDGDTYRYIKASSEKTAISKAKREVLNPGKGMSWSHSIWVGEASAREVDGSCKYFLLCKNKATTFVPNSVLGPVPCCARCKKKYDKMG